MDFSQQQQVFLIMILLRLILELACTLWAYTCQEHVRWLSRESWPKSLKKLSAVKFACQILNPLFVTDLSDFPCEMRAVPHFDRLHTNSKDAIISDILKISLCDSPPLPKLCSPFLRSRENLDCCINPSIAMSVPDGFGGPVVSFAREAGKNALVPAMTLHGFSHHLYPDYS